jgi:hypothetical protein
MLVVTELIQAPVFEHAGVKEVLIDGRELVFQDFIEVFDDGLVPLHAASPFVLVLGRPSYDFVEAKEKPLDEGLSGVL